MPPTADEADLLALVRIVRQRWWVIAATAGTSLLIVLAIVMSTERVYESETRLVVATARVVGATGAGPTASVLGAEVQIVSTDTVLGAVREAAPGARIRVVAVAPSVLRFVARASSAQAAAAAADQAADAYLTTRAEMLLDEITSRREAIGDARDDLRAEVDALGGEADTAALVAAETELILQDADLAMLSTAIDESGIGVVQAPAPIPQSPETPTPERDLFAALVAGLVLGVAIVFVAHHLES